MLPEVKALVEHYKLTPLPAEGTLFYQHLSFSAGT